MEKTIEITIGEENSGLAIKAVLSRFLGLSRREISRLKFTRGILLNGNSERITAEVKTGDILTLIFPERDSDAAVLISGIPDILYEDSDLVIVNKPAGMPCHPSHEHLDDNMGTLLQNYYGGRLTIRAVGRLDKDVSGIMVYAKNRPAAARLSKQRDEGILKKEYTAVAEGIFSEKEGTLRYGIEKAEGRRDRKVTSEGAMCVTDYRVVSETDSCSVLKISIRTGRTHQIRAGMASVSHPLCGDTLYGGDNTRIHRPALHCSRLVFHQPFTQEEHVIEAEIPQDMKVLME